VTAAGQCGSAAQSVFAAPLDAMVARFSPDLRLLRQATYYGGGGDSALALAVLPDGVILVAGSAQSANLACTTAGSGCANGAQSAHTADSGSCDGFIVRISPDLTAADNTPTLALAPVDNAPVGTLISSAPFQVTGIFAGAPMYIDGPLNAAYCVSAGYDCSCDVGGSFISTPPAMNTSRQV
jgi:hypothetical protein